MNRFIAFLRAINVGGHNVKMVELRGLFEALGLQQVATFIASGNVIFESDRAPGSLEDGIEQRLAAALGYPVATFVRSREDVAGIAGYRPFPQADLASAGALSVAFLKKPLNAKAKLRLKALEIDIDRFRSHGREVYWMCATRQSESTFSNAVFEKELQIVATWRGIRTVNRLAGKYPPAP